MPIDTALSFQICLAFTTVFVALVLVHILPYSLLAAGRSFVAWKNSDLWQLFNKPTDRPILTRSVAFDLWSALDWWLAARLFTKHRNQDIDRLRSTWVDYM